MSGTPVCTTVTAALAFGRFSESRLASGRPMVSPRPDDHDVLAGDGDARSASSSAWMPARRARQRAVDAHDQLAEVHRVQAVDVLGGVHGAAALAS